MTDIRVENHGSIILLRPLTPAGSGWLDENIGPDAPSFGLAIACEPRYVSDIIDGARADGLEVA